MSKDDKARQQARLQASRDLANKASELMDQVEAGDITPEQAWDAVNDTSKNQNN